MAMSMSPRWESVQNSWRIREFPLTLLSKQTCDCQAFMDLPGAGNRGRDGEEQPL